MTPEQMFFAAVGVAATFFSVLAGMVGFMWQTMNRQFDSVNRHFEGHFEAIDRRFELTKDTFDQLQARFDRIDHSHLAIDMRFVRMEERIDARFDRVEQKLDILFDKFAAIDKRVSVLESTK